jgi:hypothetical protein
MNVIDEIGSSVGIHRITYSHNVTESDERYGLRILQALYIQAQRCTHLDWQMEDEMTLNQFAYDGDYRARIVRYEDHWLYAVHHKNGFTVLSGETNSVILARELCSLALSDS